MPDEERTGPPWPVWLGILLAWLAVAAWTERLPANLGPAAERRLADLLAREARTPEPRRMSARRWRCLPGVGRKRALALAREHWRHGSEPAWAWADVPGIGPETERKIREWFAAHGVELRKRP